MAQDIDKKTDGPRTSTIHKTIVVVIVMMFATVVLMAILGMQIEEICTPVPLGFPACRQLVGLEWETLATGVMSLMAGLMVVFSSHGQVRATRQTGAAALLQAKMHRADDLNAPLQLARDAVDDCYHWLNAAINHLHGMQEQAEIGITDVQQLDEATGRAYTNLANRADHIKSICSEHKTTVLSYEVYSQLELVANLMHLPVDDPLDAPQGSQYEQYRRTRELFRIARTRTAAARTAIDHQISENLVRCGVED
ncbi:hypothetical protein [Thalassospira sp. A3_1]|uniref:hypothetical protein n=1 Tax=Thalassospira sp. A3_1 TaxID=2821088 RepID=UPI001ADB5F1D|nr:hypothetical protein [Thalassospira sp. A3_1]MBO9509113.1 hypothetical protein [Thalassospira sp. A3_1]